MSKHTKGPWYGADKPVFGWWTIYSNHSIGGTECISGRQAIATIPAASKKNDPVYAEMFSANARLIATAPDLLDALKKIAEYSAEGAASTGPAGWMGAIARVAIAKATGTD